MNKQPVSYLQTDARWRNIPYAVPGESATIGGSGCGPTAMAMVLATWVDPAVTPKTECAWALANGGKAFKQGTYYSYFPKAAARYGLTCYQLNAAKIYGNASSEYHKRVKAELDKGNLVIACMGKGLWTSSGHFVLVWKIEGNTVYINDPASTRAARTRGDYALFKTQVKYYFVIERPEGRKEETDMTEKETRALIQEAMRGLAAPVVYQTLEELPQDWGQPTVEKLLARDLLRGTDAGLGLSQDMLRTLVILDRAGVFDQ